MFVNTWCEIDYRFDVRRACNDAHAETYWVPKKMRATKASAKFGKYFSVYGFLHDFLGQSVLQLLI
jgi:hypothetical protein